MSNRPSIYGSLCDRIGVDDQHRSKLFWAGIVGTPILFWALSSRSKVKQTPDSNINAFFKDKSAVRPPVYQPSKKKQATSFHSFLKEVPQAHRDATSFGAFLKAPASAKAVQSNSPQAEQASKGPKANEVVISVLFGTEYGFSKEVAERVAATVTACGSYWVKLLDMADYPEGLDLSTEQALIVVCSTQGDGVAPTEARDFCDWLGSDAAPGLPNVQYAVCALGDKSYEHFCACGKQLHSRLHALGAKQLSARMDINKEDLPAIDKWLTGVTAALRGMTLQTVEETGGMVGIAETTAGKPKRWGKSRPFYGTVVAVEGLCQLAAGDDKDTIRVEIDLGDSGLQYTPGDALGVYPLNCNQAVEEVLQVLGQEGQQDVPCPTWHYQDQGQQAQPGSDQSRMLPLQQALVKCYDLRSPKPELLQLLFDHLPAPAYKGIHHPGKHSNGNGKNGFAASSGHGSSNGDSHSADVNSHTANGDNHMAEGSRKLANGDSHSAGTDSSGSNNSDCDASQSSNDNEQPVVQVDGQSNAVSNGKAHQQATDLQDILQDEMEAYLDKRHIVDILHDFSGSHPPLTGLLSCLRPLQPRLYSISSSQLEKPTRVQITVAVVKYVALGKNRVGVTSTFLKERMQVGDQVPVYVAKNPDFRLPKHIHTPIIMVGPGTGLAPFRSFMQERVHTQQSSGLLLGQNVLYFGCRRSDQDYLYGPQLEQWSREGILTLFTAFSRQQAQKVYVQDRLREGGELVWKLLQEGAHFYVCGDAAHMAGSVEQALLHIVAQHQVDGSKASADEYLDVLRQQGRYQRDVWF